ncbi:hypothetical protein, partial [Microbacterium sp.]|uniref:hypothetical protein n=1 Tax=Microbacterium sp. TaxID=51671 RepID=UPI0039E2DA48
PREDIAHHNVITLQHTAPAAPVHRGSAGMYELSSGAAGTPGATYRHVPSDEGDDLPLTLTVEELAP